MLKKRNDTDIVMSLLIQWGNKLMNHLQKEELVTQKHVRENCKSFPSHREGTTCSCDGGVCVVLLMANFLLRLYHIYTSAWGCAQA